MLSKKTKKRILRFPHDFLWGTATAAHQVEGGNYNDWSEWEQSGGRLDVLRDKKLDVEDFISGRACDSYNHWEEDLKLVKDLNCKAYRFSIEWSRIEPEEGVWNEKEIRHYREILRSLRKKNIKSFVTLWHWTNPVWAVKDGGWGDKKIVKRFGSFVEKIVDELGSEIDFFVTLNEPLMHIAHGYWTGKFPPNHKKDIFGSIKVFNNLVGAHRLAYKIIHKNIENAKVGLAMTSGYFHAAHKYCLIEKIIVKIAHYFRNEIFIRKTKGAHDFIGVNYYHHDRIVFYPPFKKNKNKIVSDFGWEIYPEGIYYVLKNYARYKKPIYILENGVADRDDHLRKDFIGDHLKYVYKALRDGVDVRGYFYWSLLDNFEWADGYGMKFGLYEVNRKNFTRKARPSADYYKEVCKNNGIEVD